VSRVLVHATFGDPDAARAEFAEFRELPDRYPIGPRWYATVCGIGMAATALGDAEVAARAYAAMRPVAHYHSGDGSGGVFCQGANAGMLADFALAAGRPDEAARLYADAVAMNDRVGARPFSALNRLGWARALLAAGTDLARAAELASTAAAELRRLDMPGRLATADATVAAVARARSARSPLSGREAEVARLVAEALSNRQIADRLVLSERTVESHVRSILTKLGFTTRTEIAAWLLREERSTTRGGATQ
jgi:DNA-binding CsgD family transcriptional regulator